MKGTVAGPKERRRLRVRPPIDVVVRVGRDNAGIEGKLAWNQAHHRWPVLYVRVVDVAQALL